MPVTVISLAAAACFGGISAFSLLLAMGRALHGSVLHGSGQHDSARRSISQRASGLVGISLAGLGWALLLAAILTERLSFLQSNFAWRLPIYGLFWLAVAQLGYTRQAAGLPTNRPQRWLPAVALTAALLALETGWPFQIDFNRLAPGWNLSTQNVVLIALSLGWGVALGRAALVLRRVYPTNPDPAQRNRLRYLILVTLLIVTGDGLFMGGYWAAGVLARALGSVLLAYSNLAPQLPALRKFLRRSISGLWVAASGVGFLWLVLAVRHWLGDQIPALPSWILDVGLAILAALVFYQLALRLQTGLAEQIAGRPRSTAELLREYSQRIGNVLDVAVLEQEAGRALRRAFNAQPGRLYLVDRVEDPQQGGSYYLRAAAGQNEPSFNLPDGQPLVDYFNRRRQAILMTELGASPGLRYAGEARTWLEGQELVAWAPIHNREAWIGLLGVGTKLSGEPFERADIEVLQTIADQTAVALENARLVAGVLRLNNEFRQAYTALEQANRRLAELDRTKTDFVTLISQELRGPLAMIASYRQILAHNARIQNISEARQALAGIEQGVGRLELLIARMLDLVQIESDDLKLEMQPVILNELVTGLAAEMGERLAGRRQTFEQDGLQALPHIQADRALLRKALFHLLENAIKFTPEGGRISVSGSMPAPVEGEKQTIELVIKDSGIGIDPQKQPLIFEKFYRVAHGDAHRAGREETARPPNVPGGPGLGLAITRGIVAAHRGEIWVESPGYDPQRCPGSEFHLRLPCTARPSEPVGNPLLHL